MKRFIGIKLVEAKPMDRKTYNKYRWWVLPADENGDDEGYLVEYLESDNPNHPNHKRYISWSPKEVFDKAYVEVKGLSFGMAIEAARLGMKITRNGWNGKGMWVVLMPALSLPPYSSQKPGARVNDRTAKHIGPDTTLDSQPYFVMRTALGQWQPGWLASQADMLARDWEIVE